MEALVRKYRRKGVLVDANLLLCFLVGSLDPRHLEGCRATTKYFGPKDYPLLDRFLGQFERLVTTPHILTEVSNLSGRLNEPLRKKFRALFREVIAKSSEHFEASETVSAHADFLRLGLADTAISMVAPARCLVLTDDALLADLLGRRSVDVVNFNHIRTGAWQ